MFLVIDLMSEPHASILGEENAVVCHLTSS